MIGGTAPIMHRLGDAARLGTRDVVDDFAAAGGVADMDRVLEVERFGQLGDIGGIGVHLVAGVGLRRATVAAAVVRDDAVALRQEEHHLVVPVVGAQRPAVVEHDRLGALGPSPCRRFRYRPWW